MLDNFRTAWTRSGNKFLSYINVDTTFTKPSEPKSPAQVEMSLTVKKILLCGKNILLIWLIKLSREEFLWSNITYFSYLCFVKTIYARSILFKYGLKESYLSPIIYFEESMSYNYFGVYLPILYCKLYHFIMRTYIYCISTKRSRGL